MKRDKIISILSEYIIYLDKDEWSDDEKIKDWYRVVDYINEIIKK
jgi:hypothetical protein